METPRRVDLLDRELSAGVAPDRVRVTRVELAPGQAAGPHRHPCDVVGLVVSGTVRFRIEGRPERQLADGDAFLEPRDTEIAAFDNASDQEPAVFVAHYLLPPGVEHVIEMR